MMGSPYDGLSRGSLRVGLAVIALASLLMEVADLHLGHAGPHPAAPFFLAWVGDRPAVFDLLAIAGAAALVLFARRPAAIREGAIALLVMALLSESRTAARGSVSHVTFEGGAALLGWLSGLAYARAVGPRSTAAAGEPGAYDEALAEAGAAAMLAATYVNAGLAKLVESGAGWASGTTLSAAILSLDRVDDAGLLGAFARFVVEHPGVARGFESASLVVETGAFLYVAHPRLRALWGVLIVGFHVSSLLLLRVVYLPAAAAVLLFAFPWPRIVARPERRPAPAAAQEIAVDPADHRRAAVLAASIVALCVSAALLLPARAHVLPRYDGEGAPP
jgi:hypothetical protein